MTTTRARRPAAKAARRRQIVDAARTLLDEDGDISRITTARLMIAAGLAKGTNYLYFATKEAVLLAVLQEDLDEVMDEMADHLPRVHPAGDPAGLARSLAESFIRRPRLLLLLSNQHAVLEANLDPAAATEFKRFVGGRLLELDRHLRPLFPGATEGDVARRLLRAHALLVGLVGMSRPPPAVAAVLETPELQWMRVDLATEFEAGLRGLLRA